MSYSIRSSIITSVAASAVLALSLAAQQKRRDADTSRPTERQPEPREHDNPSSSKDGEDK